MASQRVVVNGTDITGYLKSMQWSRNDIDAPGSGRDMDGSMVRGRVAIKAKLQFNCRVLSDGELSLLCSAVSGETVSVSYLDPLFGRRSNVAFYGSQMDAGVWSGNENGEAYWGGIAFNLIEV